MDIWLVYRDINENPKSETELDEGFTFMSKPVLKYIYKFDIHIKFELKKKTTLKLSEI